MFFAGFLALVFPKMINSFGGPDVSTSNATIDCTFDTKNEANPLNLKKQPAGALGFFAVLTVIAWILIWFLVPETKMKSLEQLSTKFDEPLFEFAMKRLKRIVPQRVVDWFKDNEGIQDDDEEEEEEEEEEANIEMSELRNESRQHLLPGGSV